MNELIVLNVGYSAMEEQDQKVEGELEVMVANCTCTLIKSHDCNIIVDTMTPWDGDLLLKSEYTLRSRWRKMMAKLTRNYRDN